MSKYTKWTGWTAGATAGLAIICTIVEGRAERFTIAVIPDTQCYTIFDTNMAGFAAQVNYVVSNRVPRNIVFATHLGDMVNDQGPARDQWARAQMAMEILRNSDVPFGIAVGNHDYDSGPVSVSGTSIWAGYFGPPSGFFQGRSWHKFNPANAPDTCQIFYGGDRAFLHIVLEMEPSTASMNWAKQIIQAHPGMPTILTLHEYLLPTGERSGNGYRGGSTGLQVWQTLVRPNSQIFMVLCGHEFEYRKGVGQARLTSTNAAGQVVFELLSDYQEAGETGSGFMRFMEFDPALQCINVSTYSPLLDAQVSDPSSQFTLTFNWDDRFGPAPAGLPPLIITPPIDQMASSGNDTTFRVFADGSPPLAYQWRLNGTNLAGATDSTYIVDDVQLADSGSQFSCLVSNAYGTMLSCDAVLTVLTQPPVILVHPADQTVPIGRTPTFSVAASGSLPLSYSWMRNGVPIAGAVHSNYTTSDVPFAASGSQFRCLVANAFGSVTSQVATLRVLDPAIIGQPIKQHKNPGEVATFTVTAAGSPPLSWQWWKDGAALAQRTDASLMLTNLRGADAGSYWAVVSSPYGSVTSTVAELTVNLATADTFNPGANNDVYCLAEQPDGKILVAGAFTTLGGQVRNRIGRLNSDGTLDTKFNPGAAGGDPVGYTAVYCLALQVDGKIVVAGIFGTLGGKARRCVGRLNSDGTVDTTFNPGVYGGVGAMAVQADGKIVVGGLIAMLGGSTCNNIGRLNSNGTVDTVFGPGANNDVLSLALQADGKILVGGKFTTLGGQVRNRIGRFNSNGTLDTTFNPGANGVVRSLVAQWDGKILVGGSFTTLGGQRRNYIGRLNTDGTVDPTFNPGTDGFVLSLVAQTDGKILVGGSFTTLGGQQRKHLGRLNADGTLDSLFNPRTEWGASALAAQADGKTLVGGWFGALNGQPRSNLGRLNSTEPTTESLSYDGSTFTWRRGGTSPEVWRTTLDVSANGTDWLSLGGGTRLIDVLNGTACGWQWTNVSLAEGSLFRMRGFVAGGTENAASWFIESAVQLRPQLFALGFNANRFGARVRAVPGQAVVIEASSDLMHWTAIQTHEVASDGVVFVTDPDSNAWPARFYRARYY